MIAATLRLLWARHALLIGRVTVGLVLVWWLLTFVLNIDPMTKGGADGMAYFFAVVLGPILGVWMASTLIGADLRDGPWRWHLSQPASAVGQWALRAGLGWAWIGLTYVVTIAISTGVGGSAVASWPVVVLHAAAAGTAWWGFALLVVAAGRYQWIAGFSVYVGTLAALDYWEVPRSRSGPLSLVTDRLPLTVEPDLHAVAISVVCLALGAALGGSAIAWKHGTHALALARPMSWREQTWIGTVGLWLALSGVVLLIQDVSPPLSWKDATTHDSGGHRVMVTGDISDDEARERWASALSEDLEAWTGHLGVRRHFRVGLSLRTYLEPRPVRQGRGGRRGNVVLAANPTDPTFAVQDLRAALTLSILEKESCFAAYFGSSAWFLAGAGVSWAWRRDGEDPSLYERRAVAAARRLTPSLAALRRTPESDDRVPGELLSALRGAAYEALVATAGEASVARELRRWLDGCWSDGLMSTLDYAWHDADGVYARVGVERAQVEKALAQTLQRWEEEHAAALDGMRAVDLRLDAEPLDDTFRRLTLTLVDPDHVPAGEAIWLRWTELGPRDHALGVHGGERRRVWPDALARGSTLEGSWRAGSRVAWTWETVDPVLGLRRRGPWTRTVVP